jgi:2,4-dienoyl-CoA reductase-like NADH-dependent reductase (Old Yellow Enzyme family)/ribulose 1,5-bisphosphate synthetase/thiazole synthase
MKYPHLFTPLQVGSALFRNRVFSAPTGHTDTEVDGTPTDREIAYYARKALGGAAAVTIGECSVDWLRGRRGTRHIDLHSSTNAYMLSRLAAAISAHGAVGSVELQHGGYAANSLGRDGPAWSSVSMEYHGHPVEQMDEDLIWETVGLFADAAAYAKRCGFGMVTVHGAHGWLVQQFLSPAVNTRADRWGGSPENRARFAVEICDAIHKKCGRDFPVEIRIGGSEVEPGGYGIEEGIQIARQLDGHADIIHVSAGASRIGAPSTFERTFPSMFLGHGPNVEFAAAIRPEVKRSVVATVGGLVEPEAMEEIVATGKADIVELARGLMCDPDLPNKAREGRDEDIRRCMRCYSCYIHLMSKGDFCCALNPESGHELAILEPVTKPRPKTVLVAGGGIAGMQAALTAAQNGNSVVLCEKADSLGGAIRCEEQVPFKRYLAAYIRQQERLLRESGVDIRLNTEVTPELVRELKPQVLALALGSEAVVPGVCRGTPAIGAEEAYTHPEKVGQRVVILGGGLVGTELSIYLAGLGRKVTVVEREKLCNDGGNNYQGGMVRRNMKKVGVTLRLNTEVTAVDGQGVTLADGSRIEADTVVYAVGRAPRRAEVITLSGLTDRVLILGDCITPRNIMAATGEAWAQARMIDKY